MLGPKMSRRDALKVTAVSGLVYTGTGVVGISEESFDVEREPEGGVIVDVYIKYGEGSDKNPTGLWQTRRIGKELFEEEVASFHSCEVMCE